MSLATSTPVSTQLQSAGPLLFAPDASPDGGAVLFVADVAAATVFAFQLPAEEPAGADIRVTQLGAKIAALLGVDPNDVVIRGMAADTVSHAVYLSIARGHGPQAGPALVRAGADGELSVVELGDYPVTSYSLDDAPAADGDQMDVWLDGSDEATQTREIHGIELAFAQVAAARSTITGLAWVGGKLVVAGLSNEEFSSRLRQIPYPFDGSSQATSVEIYHVDHGKYETQSPIRALTSFNGGAGIVASYTCTPVVQFSLAELSQGGLVRGRTVAELGPMNQPFSIVSYDRDGDEFLLVSNTRHPLLKIPASSIDSQESLSLPLSDEGSSMGVPRENLDHPGVTWMAALDRSHVVVVQHENDDVNLRTFTADEL